MSAVRSTLRFAPPSHSKLQGRDRAAGCHQFVRACLLTAVLALVLLAQFVLRSAQRPLPPPPRTLPPLPRTPPRNTTAAAAPLRPPLSPLVTTEAGAAPAASGAAASSCGDGGSSPLFEHLQLNEHARKLWACSASSSAPPLVMLTFGSNSMKDFLLNWVAHVKRLEQKLYLVGALDAQLEQLCHERGIPAATISNEVLESMGAQKLGAGAAHQYYRYAPGTFLRMGLIKQVFIRQMLLGGLDAMVSDVDVAWLASPWPLVRYGDATQPAVRPSARLTALADVVLSVDQVQQYMDTDRHRWHVDSELNTGVAFFRASAGALAVLDDWREAMAKAIAKGNPNHDQYWLNQVLAPRKLVNLKLDDAARAAWLPPTLEAMRRRDPSRVGLPASSAELGGAQPDLRALFLFETKRFGAAREQVYL